MSSGILASGPLPPIQGTGRKKRGVWSGHEDVAAEMRQLAATSPDKWHLIADDMTKPSATRIAKAVRSGTASGFEHVGDGRFEASTRGAQQKYQVWARFVRAT